MRDRMLRRRRPLIASPLEWQLTAAPVPHPVIPVLAERGGTQLQTPRPTLLVDTREQNPFNFARFQGWFAGIEKRALPLGDYSIAGLEDVCTVERKDLSDLVHSCTADRAASETHQLGEELVGSYLYQIHLYHWLESNDYGRFLSDSDV
jgi:hypothetical protein